MTRTLSVLGVLAATALAACDSPSPAGSTSAAPSAAAASSASPSAASPASAAPSAAAPGASAEVAPSASADAPKVDDASWSKETTTTLETAAGPMVFHAVHHGTLYVEVGGKVLWVDPWSEGALEGPQADLLLLTDLHPDHLDPKAIAKVKKADAVVMGPKAVEDEVPGLQRIANGETKQLGPIEVTAVPMYNEKRGPEAGKLFHDKGRGNGYVLAYGGKRVYLSGDTECTAEMKALRDIDLAFVCMNLPYTMPPEEAAACVAAFAPKTLVPYHHRGSDLSVLDAKLAGKGVKVEKLKFY